MKKIILALVVVISIVMMAVGCSKATATGPSPINTATTVNTAVVVVSSATATSTATVTPTSTVTLTPMDTPVPTNTPLTMVYVGLYIKSVSGNPSNTANISWSCGGNSVSSNETLPYDYEFSTYSNQSVAITVTAGTAGGVVEADFHLSNIPLVIPIESDPSILYTSQSVPNTNGIEMFFPFSNYY